MKKNTIIKTSIACMFLLSAVTVSFNTTSPKHTKKSLSLTSILNTMSIKTNSAYAAGTQLQQMAYTAAKTEVLGQVAEVITGVNQLLAAAGKTTCDSLPAVSATPFFTNSEHKLYSSAVNRTFPLTGITATYTHKLELENITTSTKIGSLYVDCNTGAAEVRYNGLLDIWGGVAGDTNLAIAYYKDASNLQTILLAYHYVLAGTTPENAAVKYTESANTSAISVVYTNDGAGTTGYVGAVNADTAGTATGGTDTTAAANALNNAAAELNALVGINTFTEAGIWALGTISL